MLKQKKTKKAICCIFALTRELIVIDLSKPLYVPSIFDQQNRHHRGHIRFLIDFISDFTKPIDRKDRAHIDYVPTQIVTEYIKHIFRLENESHVDGVLYPSSKNNGKNAVVIFADSEQCIDKNDFVNDNTILKLVNIETREIKGL